MRIIRWTTRRMMILVAVVGVLITGPAFLWRRSIRFEAIALAHQQERAKTPLNNLDLYMLTTCSNLSYELTPLEKKLALEDQDKRLAQFEPIRLYCYHHSELEEKYKYASAHPWLPVASDPPPSPFPSKEDLESARKLLDYWEKSIGMNQIPPQ